jgi:hypothetical protein
MLRWNIRMAAFERAFPTSIVCKWLRKFRELTSRPEADETPAS